MDTVHHLALRNETGQWALSPPHPDIDDLADVVPYGALPIFIFPVADRVAMLAGETATLRMLGRHHGLAGRTSMEAAYVDEIIDAVYDLRARIDAVYAAAAGVPQAHALAIFKTTLWPKFVDTLADRLAEIDRSTRAAAGGSGRTHAGHHGLAVGRTLSIADFALYALVEELVLIEPAAFVRAPRLACTAAAVRDAHDRVSAYLRSNSRLPLDRAPLDHITGAAHGTHSSSIEVFNRWTAGGDGDDVGDVCGQHLVGLGEMD